jgi:hypothetical protein
MNSKANRARNAIACFGLGVVAACGASANAPPPNRGSDAGSPDAAALDNDATTAPDVATTNETEYDASPEDRSEDGSFDSAASDSGTGRSTGDVVGKITVGYQGWFDAVGDGSPANQWWHYDQNTGNPPSPADYEIKAWPDVTDFTTTYQSGFANLGNGMPATLFSSYVAQTVQTHMQWMQQNGIDTAALQRFYDETPTRNADAVTLMNGAQMFDRKFYIMYDISGWTNFDTLIPADWTNVIVGQLKLTASPSYAMQNGKAVVNIWGCGFPDRPGTVATCTSLINFFKGQGMYVIGGVPLSWQTSSPPGSLPDFGSVYDLFDMISPWMIGVIADSSDSDTIRMNYNEPDVVYCQSHNIDYQPCVLPGDLSLRQRVHGDFMWHQLANMIQVGANGIYVSMFDEFNEGNQIAKTAANASMIPTNSSFLTLDEDGTACSSDYYLRLTGDGGRMLKGQIPFTFTRPTSPM